jgi:hypothetical protein
MEPEYIKFLPDQIEKIMENGGILEVQIEDGVYKFSL